MAYDEDKLTKLKHLKELAQKMYNDYTTLADELDVKAAKSTTLSGYGITDAYTKTQVDGKISAVYKPGGSKAFASLPTPAAGNLGIVYNVTDAFTTTSAFVEGAGKAYPAGTNVVVVQVESAYKYDTLSGFVDLSPYAGTAAMNAALGKLRQELMLEIDSAKKELLDNPAMYQDVTQQYLEACESNNAIVGDDFLQGFPEGQYCILAPTAKYFARNVVSGGVTYSDITFYEDDCFVYHYRYIGGIKVEEWETFPRDVEPLCNTTDVMNAAKQFPALQQTVDTINSTLQNILHRLDTLESTN